MTSIEPDSESSAAESPEDARARGAWFKDRAVGLLAVALVAVGQGTILLAYLFTPPDDPDTLMVERHWEHWTADLTDWWLRLTAIAACLAVLGLVMDKNRDIAAAALGAAVIGFVWPWGL